VASTVSIHSWKLFHNYHREIYFIAYTLKIFSFNALCPSVAVWFIGNYSWLVMWKQYKLASDFVLWWPTSPCLHFYCSRTSVQHSFSAT
jgi:hypothetical protein